MSNFREAFLSKYTLIIVGLFFLTGWWMASTEEALTVKKHITSSINILNTCCSMVFCICITYNKKK